LIVLGCVICPMTLFWATSDIVIACVAIPNVLALVSLAFSRKRVADARAV